MLIVITAPSYITVFLVSLTLMKVIFTEGNPIPTEFEDFNSTTVSSTEEDLSVNISSLPFSHHLTNPCSSTQRIRGNRIMGSYRSQYEAEFYKYITTYANWYMRDTQHIMNEYAVSGCSSLGLDKLPETPSMEQLSDMDSESAMNQMYYSLLMHSAYTYFIHHQYKEEIPRCPELLSDEKHFADLSLILANKQKSLVCTIEVSMSLLGYNQNTTNSILEQQITQLSLCSRMAIRDCQVLRSLIHLLDVLKTYAESRS